MNFLAPLFLLGALAVAAPVIFHLIRRATKERTVFSSLMFLRPTPPRLNKRNRLEHLLLLLLRCAVLGLLAAAFARPFIREVVPENLGRGDAKRIVVLVDTSASMRRGNLWTSARSKAEEILRKAAPADHVALFTFDRGLNPLVTFEQWDGTAVDSRVAFAQGRLAETTPSWSGTMLDQALIRASEMLADATETNNPGPRQIVVISDLQAGSHLSGVQAYDWPKGIEVQVERITPQSANNAGIQLLADASDTTRSSESTVRVRVINESDSKREQFQVGWARDGGTFITNASEVYVPPGQSRVVSLPALGTNSVADRIRLQGDDEDFDNTVFVVPPEAARMNVIYLGAEKESDPRQPLYFVERAFQETRRQNIQVRAILPSAPLTEEMAAGSTLFIATDSLPVELAQALRQLVQSGKTLLFAPTTAAATPTLRTLLNLDSLVIEEGRTANYAMLGEIDFRHPIFAPFADPRFSDFTKIHFWQYRRLNATAIPDARVVAKFDNGDAAILEVPLGKGRVLMLASGWHPADSQLALSSKFVPLLYSMVELSGGVASAPVQYLVGDSVPLPSAQASTNAATSLIRPDGAPLTLAAGETNFSRTLSPGIYRLNGGLKPMRFAVNLDAAESRTAPLPLDELERMGAPTPKQATVVAHAEERKVRMQSAELEGRQKLWRWLLAATLAIVLIETWLAGWTARRESRTAIAT